MINWKIASAALGDEALVARSLGCAAFIYSARPAGIAAIKALRLHAPDATWAGFQEPLGYFVGTGIPDGITPLTLRCADWPSQ